MARNAGRRGAVVCLVVALGAASLYVAGSRLRGTDGGSIAQAAADPGEAPQASRVLNPPPALQPMASAEDLRFVLGATSVHSLELRAEASLSGGRTSSSAAPWVSFELEGGWVETFVGGDERVARYRIEVTDARLSGAQLEDPRALRDELAVPFFIEREYDGPVTALYFERRVGSIARGMLKSAAAMLQVVVRAGREWTTSESDPTGEYEAQYTRQTDPLAIRKARQGYGRLATSRGLRPTVDVGHAEVKDNTSILLTPSGEVDTLRSSLDTDVQVGEGMPHAKGRLVGTFVFRERRVDPSHVGDFAHSGGRLERVGMIALPEISATAEAARESDEQIVGSASLADLTQSLARIPESDRKGRAEAMARLRADFRLRPEDAAKSVAVVEGTSLEDGKAITAALGGVGTGEAQRALVSIVDDPRTEMAVRMNASTAVLLLEHPEPALVADLSRQMIGTDEDVRAASSLALGAVVRHLGDDARSERAAGMVSLLSMLDRATSAEQRVLGFKALGNSGDSSVLPLAHQALSDAAPEVRAAAVNAVRFVRDPGADDLLSSAMLTDADPQVRKKSIDTVTAFRFVPGYFASYAAILEGDPFPQVRRAVALSLRRVSAMTEAIELLRRAARDPSEDVRAVANAVLTSQGSVAP